MPSMTADTRWERRANRVTGNLRATGGRLTLEGDRLTFRPNAIERAVMAKEWSIPLSEVSGFRTVGVQPLKILAGGLRPRLALDVGTATTHLFVVPDPEGAARELEALARA